MDLAEKVSGDIKLDIAYDQYAVDDLLVEIPNPMKEDNDIKQDDDGTEYIFGFEINEEIELQRKREINRRKREKNAIKLRKKYKDNPELYKDPAIVAKMTQARSVINSKRMRPRPAPKSNIQHQDPYLMMRHVDNNKIPSIHCQCKWCILRNYANSITLTADAQNISATVMNGNKLIGAMKHFQKKIKKKLEPCYWDVIGAIINDHME